VHYFFVVDGVLNMKFLKSIFSRYLRTENTAWRLSDRDEYHFESNFNGDVWSVRINDFPDEPWLFSLFVNGKHTVDFNEWPEEYWGEEPLEELTAKLRKEGLIKE